MAIWTAQYRYSGRDRLDITVKGNDIAGKLFAPTWQMVTDYKKKILSQSNYATLYYELLQKREDADYYDFGLVLANMVVMVTGAGPMPERDLTAVCFCPAGEFCHRHLFVNWLTSKFPQVKYGGERQIVGRGY